MKLGEPPPSGWALTIRVKQHRLWEIPPPKDAVQVRGDRELVRAFFRRTRRTRTSTAGSRGERARGGVGGTIVNLSSAAARLGAAGEYIDYAASKAAVDAVTVGLSKEVAAEGIRVNSVRPGSIHTEIHASGGEPDRVDRIAKIVPMKRGGEPEEIAEAILWLISDKASYTTGTILEVTGGI